MSSNNNYQLSLVSGEELLKFVNHYLAKFGNVSPENIILKSVENQPIDNNKQEIIASNQSLDNHEQEIIIDIQFQNSDSYQQNINDNNQVSKTLEQEITGKDIDIFIAQGLNDYTSDFNIDANSDRVPKDLLIPLSVDDLEKYLSHYQNNNTTSFPQNQIFPSSSADFEPVISQSWNETYRSLVYARPLSPLLLEEPHTTLLPLSLPMNRSKSDSTVSVSEENIVEKMLANNSSCSSKPSSLYQDQLYLNFNLEQLSSDPLGNINLDNFGLCEMEYLPQILPDLPYAATNQDYNKLGCGLPVPEESTNYPVSSPVNYNNVQLLPVSLNSEAVTQETWDKHFDKCCTIVEQWRSEGKTKIDRRKVGVNNHMCPIDACRKTITGQGFMGHVKRHFRDQMFEIVPNTIIMRPIMNKPLGILKRVKTTNERAKSGEINDFDKPEKSSPTSKSGKCKVPLQCAKCGKTTYTKEGFTRHQRVTCNNPSSSAKYHSKSRVFKK